MTADSQPDETMAWPRKNMRDALALALMAGIVSVWTVVGVFPNVRSKVKPIRIQARNHVSQFVASLPVQTNQNAVAGSLNPTPGLVGE